MTQQKPVEADTDLKSMRLRRLLQYWRDRCRDSALPGRADIDPLDLPWILGDISLVEVHRTGDAFQYRFRLVGTRVVERFGFDFTNRWLADFPGAEYRRHVGDAFNDVVRQARPFAERTKMLIDQRPYDYEVLRLPLATDGRRVDMLLIAADFSDD